MMRKKISIHNTEEATYAGYLVTHTWYLVTAWRAGLGSGRQVIVASK